MTALCGPARRFLHLLIFGSALIGLAVVRRIGGRDDHVEVVFLECRDEEAGALGIVGT